MIANTLPPPRPPSTPRFSPLTSRCLRRLAPLLPSLALLRRDSLPLPRGRVFSLASSLAPRCIISSTSRVFLPVLLDGSRVLPGLFSVMAQLFVYIGSTERFSMLLDAIGGLEDGELIASRSNRRAISAICNLAVTRYTTQNKLWNWNFRDGKIEAKCGITEFVYTGAGEDG